MKIKQLLEGIDPQEDIGFVNDILSPLLEAQRMSKALTNSPMLTRSKMDELNEHITAAIALCNPLVK